MNATDVAQQYFAAWGQHDAAALLSIFAQGGTYCDPTTHGEIAGTAIGAMATALWQAFPDLSFQIVSLAETRPGSVAAEWLMTGTNHGDFRGLPASGKPVSLPGADFIEVDGGKLRSVTGYFDTRAIPEQLGLQVVVQPHAAGPFRFGISTSVQTGKRTKPGAFAITQMMNTSDDEVLETRDLVRNVGRELVDMEGFIGMVTARIGARGVTISAWETPDQPRQLISSEAHGVAMRRMFSGLGESTYTSVWAPVRINAIWVRCAACRKVSDFEQTAGLCPCGARLPEPAPYW